MGFFDKIKKQSAEPAPRQSDAAETVLIPHVGRTPYPAYRGREPYIFVSYAHLDAEKVFPEIKQFNEQGYNVWYDEGISPGNEWTGEIAAALEGCTVFVVFITPNSAKSVNVEREINFALDDGKAPIAIHLEETVLRGGMKLQLSTIQAILKYKMTEEEYIYKYTGAFTRMGLQARPKTKAVPPVTLRGTAPGSGPVTQNQDAANPEVSRVGDFLVEHGLLRGYLGRSPDIVLPEEVQIIGSSGLGQGSRFVETVDLNKAGALLDGAFTDCPKLREITIPPTVTMIQKKSFVNCPQLVLYCYRNKLPNDFAEQFGGKEIVYLGEETQPSALGLSFGEWVGKQIETEKRQKNSDNQ